MINPVPIGAPSVWEPTYGEKLGPAWLAAAEHLKTGDWYYTYDLYTVMSEASGLPFERVASRLKGAIRYGLLERSKAGGRTVVRVTDHGRQTRPELRA